MSLFIDTNILVYAHDWQAGVRYQIATGKIQSLWEEGLTPSVSAQVLQELYVNLLRKKTSPDVAKSIVKNYTRWNVIPNDASLLLEAIDTSQRWQLSLWDALIIEAARRAGASELWSEDLNAGQDFAGVRVINPLI